MTRINGLTRGVEVAAVTAVTEVATGMVAEVARRWWQRRGGRRLVAASDVFVYLRVTGDLWLGRVRVISVATLHVDNVMSLSEST